jgi:lipopolysaccharide transport system permease protein
MSVSESDSDAALKSLTQAGHDLSSHQLNITTRAELPSEPLVIIEPGRRSQLFDLATLWVYRDLLYFLTWRDVKIRYKQTLLGIAWVILQPLASTLIFTIFLGKLARVPSNGIPYPILIYAGLLPWTFFANALNGATTSLISSAHLITKIYFPRLIIPISGVCARLPDFAIAFVILIGMIFYYRVPITLNVLMLPVLIVLLMLLTLGFGLLFGALNVKYRDFGVMLPVLIQLGMFVSPVVYSTTLVPARWRLIFSLNPMVGIIDGFRAALIAQPFNWPALAISAIFTIVLLALSAYVFRGVERAFADIV